MTSGLAGPSPLGLSQSWAWPVLFHIMAARFHEMVS